MKGLAAIRMLPDTVSAALFDSVTDCLSRDGIEGFSLREITARIGRSTSAVFQLFGGRDELLRATMADLLAREQAFHDRRLAGLQGVPLTPSVLAGIVIDYIQARNREPSARAWLEAIYKSAQFPGLADLCTAWNAIRIRFWADLLDGSPFAPLAPPMPAYVLSEEAYAATLAGRADYMLLLREAIDGMIAGCGGTHDAGHARGAIGLWAEQRAFADLPAARAEAPARLEQLMDIAAQEIVRGGASGLNIKKIAQQAGVPPSQIVYHFGDFATFRTQAIWKALMLALPAYLNLSNPAPTADVSDWNRVLALTIVPGGNGKAAGFYVNYARTLGQTSLAAGQDADLATLVMQLRTIEGSGIHSASHNQWPPSLALSRDAASAFAIWIKGHAILNEAMAANQPDAEHAAVVMDAARALASGLPPLS